MAWDELLHGEVNIYLSLLEEYVSNILITKVYKVMGMLPNMKQLCYNQYMLIKMLHYTYFTWIYK